MGVEKLARKPLQISTYIYEQKPRRTNTVPLRVGIYRTNAFKDQYTRNIWSKCIRTPALLSLSLSLSLSIYLPQQKSRKTNTGTLGIYGTNAFNQYTRNIWSKCIETALKHQQCSFSLTTKIP